MSGFLGPLAKDVRSADWRSGAGPPRSTQAAPWGLKSVSRGVKPGPAGVHGRELTSQPGCRRRFRTSRHLRHSRGLRSISALHRIEQCGGMGSIPPRPGTLHLRVTLAMRMRRSQGYLPRTPGARRGPGINRGQRQVRERSISGPRCRVIAGHFAPAVPRTPSPRVGEYRRRRGALPAPGVCTGLRARAVTDPRVHPPAARARDAERQLPLLPVSKSASALLCRGQHFHSQSAMHVRCVAGACARPEGWARSPAMCYSRAAGPPFFKRRRSARSVIVKWLKGSCGGVAWYRWAGGAWLAGYIAW